MKYWYSNNLASLLLLPISWLFGLLAFFRRFLFRTQILQTTGASVPVAVVGNISVGGSGKTPFIIGCANRLIEAGYKVGIVSRGYKSSSKSFPLLVEDNTPVDLSGDEPALIFSKTNIPVVIDPVRPRGVQKLVDLGCQVVLSDDGLQHYAMARDLEICIVDGRRRFGNGRLFPAGPLREGQSRLKRCDYVVTNGGNAKLVGSNAMKLAPTCFYNIKTAESFSLNVFEGKKVHAVSGIGDPHRFFETLRGVGAQVIEHPFGDHHRFDESDLNYSDDLPIVMTEKDAVKCKSFRQNAMYALAVDAEMDEEFWTALIERFELLIQQKES